MTLNELERKTLEWSHNRGILNNGNVHTQTLKLMSEVGELADNMAKGRDCKDDIGDCIVVLTNLATMIGSSVGECWEVAYEDIKDRKGYLNQHGTFIKESDQARINYD